MKILFVNKFLYQRGGAVSYVLRIGKYFEEHGHEVMYFGMLDQKNEVGNKWGLYTSHMDFHSTGLRTLLYPVKIIYSFEAYRKFSELLERFRPDIVHLNNINFQITPSVIDAAWKKNIPVVQTVHDSQMVCPSHLLYNAEKEEICRKCIEGSKWNCVRYRCIHGSVLKSLIGSVEGLFYSLKTTYDKVALYICPSSFMESVLCTKKRYQGKTKVIPNFIMVPSHMENFIKKDYILYFGRLSQEKGIQLFLQLASRHPELQFKIAGSGPLKESCCARSNVQYLGVLTGEKLYETIAGAKLVVFPSVCYENCPLSVLESISLGTPVVASGRGGTRDLIRDGENGVLVREPFGIDSLDRSVKSLLEQPGQIERMSRYCAETRKCLWSLEKYGKEMEKIYRSFL